MRCVAEARVDSITIEHTPAADVFGDQTGRGGVDCVEQPDGDVGEPRSLLRRDDALACGWHATVADASASTRDVARGPQHSAERAENARSRRLPRSEAA